jgi:hypothetical protein
VERVSRRGQLRQARFLRRPRRSIEHHHYVELNSNVLNFNMSRENHMENQGSRAQTHFNSPDAEEKAAVQEEIASFAV